MSGLLDKVVMVNWVGSMSSSPTPGVHTSEATHLGAQRTVLAGHPRHQPHRRLAEVEAGLPRLSADGGSIVIISSTHGLRGTVNTAHYTASKDAVVGLARTLANELGHQRIRVTTVHMLASVLCSVRRSSTSATQTASR